MPRKRGPGAQTKRSLKLLELLQGRPLGLRLRELETKCRASPWQIKRDLDMLDGLGHHVVTEAEDAAPYYRRVKLRSKTLAPASASASRGERFSLLLWLAMMDVLDGTALREDARSVFEKLTAMLSSEERRDLKRLRARIKYVPDGGVVTYRGKADIFDALLTGVLNGRLVEGRYGGDVTDPDDAAGAAGHSAGRTAAQSDDPPAAPDPGPRAIWAPLGFAHFRQRLYVVAAPAKLSTGRADAPKLAKPRLYACDRFVDAQVRRGEGFEVPDGFSMDAFFDGAFGIARGGKSKAQRVVIDFDRRAARSVIERRWHPTQEREARPGGGVRLSFTPSSLFEVPSWVLGGGDLAAVVAPAGLRARVIETHLRSLERHGLDVSAVRAQLGR